MIDLMLFRGFDEILIDGETDCKRDICTSRMTETLFMKIMLCYN